ncbi:MAG: adenosylcobinamide-phosphate synthase CbiB [Bacillota bacterium]|nr:adenosylcobinamide-phosphate synthase CbiB [Bacillota bacterium]
MIPLTLGYLMDLVLGDSHNIPHPVRFIGKFIYLLETLLLTNTHKSKVKKISGILLWFLTISISYLIPYVIILFISKINIYISIAVETLMCYFILATKSLKDETMKVYQPLKKNDIETARKHLSLIVGRDTKKLKKEGIIKAAIETVSENISDGIIAPMIFIALGGAPLGFAYKAINTLDSMVGYKSKKYKDFGWFSAKADDVANFIPARLSALLMIISSFLSGYDYKSAAKIYVRDRYKHSSPNSAHTEAVAAGALHIALGGPNYYDGMLVEKPYIGDNKKNPETRDILKVFKLMYITSFLSLILSLLIISFIN